MDKNAIFNEFKKTKEVVENKSSEAPTKKETIIEEKEEKSEIVKVDNIITNKNKSYKRNNRRNKKKNSNSNIVKLENNQIINKGFEEWKENFLSDETNQEFMSLLDFYRDKNFTVFSNEEFLKNKYEHPSMKVVILDPTLLEINAGKGGNCCLIKPLYTDEYNYFLKNIGTRDQKPEEFMKYAVKVGTIFPKFDDKILEKTGAGTILALYNYILQFSDLTKTIKILEV